MAGIFIADLLRQHFINQLPQQIGLVNYFIRCLFFANMIYLLLESEP